jgi:hypothetical protein
MPPPSAGAVGAAGGLRALRTPTGQVINRRTARPAPATGTAEQQAAAGPAPAANAAPPFAMGVQAAAAGLAAPPRVEPVAGPGSAGGWSASSTIPTGGGYVAPVSNAVQAPVEPWNSRRTGWAAPEPGSYHQVLDAAKASPYRAETEKRAAGNTLWMLGVALTSGGVLAIVYSIDWYRRVVAAPPSDAPAVLYHKAKLLAPGYGEWRLVLPIAAAALIVLSLFTALAYYRKRYPRLLVLIMRLAAFAMVGTTVAAQLARTPHYSGFLEQAITTAQNHGVQFYYYLGTAGWPTLVVAIVAFACTLPVTSDMH